MKREIILLSAFALAAVCPVRAQKEKEKTRNRYEIEYGEPVYYKQLIDRLDFPLAWENAGIEDFGEWNRAAREKLFECMLALPPEVPFDYTVTEEERRDGYTARKIEFNISGYARVPAYLLVPDGEGPFPALVMLHDHGAEFFIGKEKMVRPFGEREDVTARAREWVDNLYSGNFVGDDYARNGYAVLSVDALYWGDRSRKEGINYDGQQALSANLLQLGMSWTGLITYEDMRSVDFLASLPFVDGDRIGCVGFSMGGHRAWMLSAAHEKVAASVAICWMNTTEYLMTPRNNQLKGVSAYSMILPGIRNYMDYPHVASLTCPRPLLVFNGLHDKLFPVQGSEDAFAILRGTWESQGAGENLVTRMWDAPHIFHAEMQSEVLEFFNRHLK